MAGVKRSGEGWVVRKGGGRRRKGWEGAKVCFGLGGALEARSTRPSLLPAPFLLFLKEGVSGESSSGNGILKPGSRSLGAPGSHLIGQEVAAVVFWPLLPTRISAASGDWSFQRQLGRRGLFLARRRVGKGGV